MTNLSKIFLITPTQPTFEERSMEKFTKFRDPGTGIAPFLPIAPGNRTPFILPFEIALCIIRTPLIFLLLAVEAVFVEGIGEICLRPTVPFLVAWVRWLFLRAILVLCGIWWVDEQLDGVSKSRAHCHVLSSLYSQTKLAIPPKPGNLIVSNFTSPLDVVYFAAKYELSLKIANFRYDAAFVSCFVTSDKVQLTSFLTALWRSINSPLLEPPDNAMLIPLTEVTKKLPDRIIVVFPEVFFPRIPADSRQRLRMDEPYSSSHQPSKMTLLKQRKYTPVT